MEDLRGRFSKWRAQKNTFEPDIAAALTSNQASSKWGTFLTKTARLDGVEVSGGNTVEILDGRQVTLEAMVQAINGATTRVWLETYIFDDSAIADRVVEALLAAKDRGCDVILLIDYIGSSAFRRRSELETAGVPVVMFNPFPWSHWMDSALPRAVGPVPFRDHRKILITDETAFCGSMNVQADPFYELNARLEGPCVGHLANVFRDSLEESGTGVQRAPIYPLSKGGSAYVQVLQSNVRKQRVSIQKALAGQLGLAEAEVCVASSYFMPPGFLKKALLKSHAAVRLVVSGTTDFWPVPGDLLAQTHALSRFVGRPNTTVSLYSAEHMHAKFTVVDSLYTQIGSYNFDRFSSRRNLECAIAVFDRATAARVREVHARLATNGTQAKSESSFFANPLARAVCWFAYLVMKTSGRNVFDGFDGYRLGVRRKELLVQFGRPDRVATCLAF